MPADIRRQIITVEEVWHEKGPRLSTPIKRGWAAVVLKNPFAGRYVEELVPFMEELEPLAYQLSIDLLKALGVSQSDIESYGKGSIVGVDGEMEHAAIWHNPG